MKKFGIEDFKAALLEVGVSRGDTLLIHSSLFSLGLLENAPVREMPALLYKAIKAIITEEGTVVVPTFTYQFCRNAFYDKEETASEKMGEFSEYIRKHQDSIRSNHPMESVAAIGKKAAFICETDSASSYADDGPFDRLLKEKAKLLYLGASYKASSIVHRAEVKLQVPYRFWKNFTGEYVSNGSSSQKTYSMYARDLNLNPLLTIGKITASLENDGKVAKAKVGAGEIICIDGNEMYSRIYDAIAADPYALVDKMLGQIQPS